MSLEGLIHHFAPGHSDVDGIDVLLEGPAGAPAADALREVLGGKGAGLHATAARGFLVPCGFTVSTAWCAAFHAGGRRLPPGLREEIRRATAVLEARTGRGLGAPAHALLVAVRSGAARSMPGMMDTVLNVDSLEGILQAIERVFLSWESNRAIAYRKRKGLEGLRGTAVVVQEMCPAELAGVAFSADPASGEPVITVEAVRGLGEALVSGAVTPERHRLRRPGLDALERRTSADGPLLSPGQLHEVATLALRVEEAFGHSVDVEWAVAGGKTYLLQARAVASAITGAAIRARLHAEAARLRARAEAETRPERAEAAILVRHNLDQTLSHPTPMTRDALRELFGKDGGFQGLYLDLGFRPSRAVREEGFLVIVCGRIFADPGRAAELFYGTRVLHHDTEELKRRPELLDEPPSTWDRTAATPLNLLRTLWRVARAQRRLEALRREFTPRFLRDVLPRYLAWCRAKEAENLSALDAQSLLVELEERTIEVFRRFPREALKLSFLAATAHAELREILQRGLGEKEGAAALMTLLSVLEGDAGLELSRRLAALGRGEITAARFLESHGHRAPQEMELARPRWREDPGALSSLAGSQRSGAGPDLETRTVERRQAMEAEERRVESAFRAAGGDGAVAEVRARLKEARELLPWRETWKHHWMLGLDLVRRALLELDHRLGLDGGIFYLTRAELREITGNGGCAGGRHLEWIRHRREEERVDGAIGLPASITAEELERLAGGRPEDRAAEGGKAPERSMLRGEPLSPGHGEGRAWISSHPAEPCSVQPPFVLVCPSTDPSWTPLIAKASAVVVERGGALSHGAIVCRDFGVPAVVVPGATAEVSAGELLRVDGGTGTVTRPEAGEPGKGDRPVDATALQAVPAEPYVPPAPRGLARRAGGGLAVAMVVSLVLVALPAPRSILQPVLRAALDWTLDLGWAPFQSIAFAALVSAVLAAAIQLGVGDRRLLRRMRARLAWYRRQIRAARAAGASRAVATLERRRRQASIERGLELLRPVGWAFLPFCLSFLWVMDRFSAEPIRPGATFTVRSVFRPAPGAPPLRYARLDAGVPGSVRRLDAPFQKLEPNSDDPSLGPYQARWSLEALAEDLVPLTVTTLDERLGTSVLITRRRELAPADAVRCRRPGAPEGPEIVCVEVERPPLQVELPRTAFEILSGIARWVTGGRGITPRQAALGPATSFLLCSVLLALLLQRLTGIR